MKTHQTYQSYQIYHTNSSLTTNPNEYGYFCDPGLDINTNQKYQKHFSQYYSYYNYNNTIYENDIYENDIYENDIENNSNKYKKDTDNIHNKYNKNKNKIHCLDSAIYGFIVIGSVTITTLLVKYNII